MNKNIFFNTNKKFNHDINSKFNKKKNERKTGYTFKNMVDKPILIGDINQDTPINLKQKIFDKQKERSLLDAQISQKKPDHRNFISKFDYSLDQNIIPTKPKSNKNKSDKLLDELKKLGIIK